eukprot:scaffold169271_cov34-Prasinocladus_malaysianus.AAC.1
MQETSGRRGWLALDARQCPPAWTVYHFVEDHPIAATTWTPTYLAGSVGQRPRSTPASSPSPPVEDCPSYKNSHCCVISMQCR